MYIKKKKKKKSGYLRKIIGISRKKITRCSKLKPLSKNGEEDSNETLQQQTPTHELNNYQTTSED